MIEEVPDELIAWLDRAAEVLAGRSHFGTAAGGWSPAASSHAQWEMEKAIAAGWADGEPVVVVQSALIDYWDVADGFLGAMEALVRARRVAHALPYLTRGVLEHCHRICWLLAPTERVDGKERPLSLESRAARGYLEELHSLRHRRDAVEKLCGRSSPEAKECDAALAKIRTDTARAFEACELDGEPDAWRVAGQRWRGPTALAEWYAKNRGPSTKGAYDALSGMSHPNLYSIREFVEYLEGAGGLIRRRSISQDFLLRIMTGAVTTYWRAGMDLVSYYGWDQAPMEAWAAEINAWCPDSIGTTN